MSLKEYNEKRDFNSTSEPKGSKKKSSAKKFVIQYHQARAKHYDFRLEYNGVLLSWAVPKGLSQNPKDKRLAVKVEDHPIDYMNFEGIIPKGNYGAGTVEIFDKGDYLPIENISKGLKKGHVKIVLNGEKLKGGWSLVHLKEDNWLIVKIDDDYALQNNKKKNTRLPFESCTPQLATLSQTLPKGKEWVYEIKYDGYRMLGYVEKDKVKLLSRNNIDYTNKFKDIILSLGEIEEDSFVVDGEIVVFDDTGRSDFGLLQESIKHGKYKPYYVIFDLLALNGEDLRELPLLERKTKLERLLFKAENNLIYSSHVNKGKECFEFAKKNNLEGIVAKKINSSYLSKRSEEWLKIKCYLRQEFVVAGYTTTEKNEHISALLLGYYKDKKLVYVGKVGTGFNAKDKQELHKSFQKYIRKSCPFVENIKEKNVTWISPHFVAEIQYSELTKDNLLRQPSFIGIRKDKNAKDVVLENKV